MESLRLMARQTIPFSDMDIKHLDPKVTIPTTVSLLSQIHTKIFCELVTMTYFQYPLITHDFEP
jgi:hypothetical protein